MRHPSLLLAWLAVFCGFASLQARYEQCPVAPAARPKVMLEGEAVGAFAKDKVYIVALWARWPGNREAVDAGQYRENVGVVPQMARLQRTLGDKGLVVLTVAFGEKDPAETRKVIERFKGSGDGAVRVGFDSDRAMADGWLEGDINRRTPHAFVIAEGRVIWQGHPQALRTALVASFIDGTFSPERAAELEAKAQAAQEAVLANRFEEAEKLLQEVLPLMPEEDRAGFAKMIHAGIAVRKGDPSLARRQMLEYAEASKDDPVMQNEMANNIMKLVERSGDHSGDASFLEVASLCAERAVKLANEHKAGGNAVACCLDTLARVRFLQGRKDEAVRLQEQAVATMVNAGAKKALRETLESYRRGVLPPMIEDPSEFSR